MGFALGLTRESGPHCTRIAARIGASPSTRWPAPGLAFRCSRIADFYLLIGSISLDLLASRRVARDRPAAVSLAMALLTFAFGVLARPVGRAPASAFGPVNVLSANVKWGGAATTARPPAHEV